MQEVSPVRQGFVLSSVASHTVVPDCVDRVKLGMEKFCMDASCMIASALLKSVSGFFCFFLPACYSVLVLKISKVRVMQE